MLVPRCLIAWLLLSAPSSAAEMEAAAGAVVPSRDSPSGVRTASVLHVSLLATPSSSRRFASGLQLEHLAWGADLAPEIGSAAVSGVWRIAGVIRLDLGDGRVRPFLAADGGVMRYRIAERVSFGGADTPLTVRTRTWHTAKASAGGQAGIAGPLSNDIAWSIAFAWIGVLDEELPDYAGVRAGLRFGRGGGS
jgi:hypothetical protein